MTDEGYDLSEVINEEDVADALDKHGVEHPDTRELLDKYARQCEAEADAEAAADPENPVASNRANIKTAIKMATLYPKTRNYKQQALEMLEEAYQMASQNESTADLAMQADVLIAGLSLKM